jgi:hypothetical protein
LTRSAGLVEVAILAFGRLVLAARFLAVRFGATDFFGRALGRFFVHGRRNVATRRLPC